VSKELARLLALLFAPLSACSSQPCASFKEIAAIEQKSSAIIQWVDSDVFPAHFTEDDLAVGGYRGPGIRFIVNEEILKNQPKFIKGYEVRLVGSDPMKPAGVFIGEGPFRGILISRHGISDILQRKIIYPADIVLKSNRIAVLCRPLR